MNPLSSQNILESLLYGKEHKKLIHNALIRNLNGEYFFGPHCHINIELCLMLEGECDIIVNGESHTVHTHELFLLFPNVIHSFYVHENSSCQFLQLHFSPEIFFNLNSQIYEEQQFLYYLATETRQFLNFEFTDALFSCVNRIECEMNSNSVNHIALANLYIYELILLLSRTTDISNTDNIETCHPTVLKAVHYINGHLTEKLSLDEISGYCNISKRYLMKIFQDSLHVTVNDYINLSRINIAMNEISSKQSCNLTELAHRLGFSSVQYFTTIFKKYAGVTPKNYASLNELMF